MDQLYARCRDAFLGAGARASFAETHGVLCGLLCAPGGVAGSGWLEELLGDSHGDRQALASCRELLAMVLERSARDLGSAGFEFTPLLPDDDEALDARCIALGEWCGGFLYGLGSAGAVDLDRLSAEVREQIADLGQLARLASEGEQPGGDEGDYAELVEYLRVAVMNVYEETVAGGAKREPPARD